jgi:hypothetical protein
MLLLEWQAGRTAHARLLVGASVRPARLRTPDWI